MEKFTASEVRELAATIWPDLSGREEVAETLNAFADMLEAQEKAEAIGFLSGGALAALVDCRSDDYNGNVDLWMRSNDAVKATIPVYTRPSPSDAERLAEALRNLVSEWVAIADDGDATLEDSTIGYRACANRLSAMLAAHSAKAQPPAASVTDAMVERALSAYYVRDIDSAGFAWEDAVGDPRIAESDMRAALEAALAAQENPNG